MVKSPHNGHFLCPQAAHCRFICYSNCLKVAIFYVWLALTPLLLKGVWQHVFCVQSLTSWNYQEQSRIKGRHAKSCKSSLVTKCCGKYLMYRISFFFRLPWCYQYSLDYSRCQRSCFHFYFWCVEIFTVF